MNEFATLHDAREILRLWREDPEDFDSDPIVQANELRAHGLIKQARELLSNLIDQEVRCLDAHAHLGSMEFDQKPGKAIEHYQRGVKIGRLSLGKNLSGVLPWGMIDNRGLISGWQNSLWDGFSSPTAAS